MNSTSSNLHTTEEIGHGVRREMLEDGRIMVLTMPDTASREAVDTWFEAMVEIGNVWDMSRPFLVMHDIQAMGFSQYFRDRSIELSKYTPPEITGRGAVVLPRSIVGTLLSVAARISSRRLQPEFELRLFTDYNKALAWLRESL